MYSLSHRNIKALALYILIGLFAYSSAGALLRIMAERTLGSIFRHLMFTTPYLFLIILVSLYDTRRFSFSSLVPTIPSDLTPILILKRYWWIMLVAVLLGMFTFSVLGDLALLYGIVIVFLVGSLLTSCYCIMSEKTLVGIIMFLIAIPLLFFLQINHKQTGFGEIILNDVGVPLSAIYLVTISVFFLLAKLQSGLRDITKKERYFIRLCAIFVSIPIFSIIFSKDPSHSLVYYTLDLVLPFIYFIILMNSIKTVDDIKHFIFFLVISIVVYEFFTIYFQYQRGEMKYATYMIRSAGVEKNTMYTGFMVNLMPLIIPFQVALYKLLRGSKRVSIGLSLLFFLFYVVISNSRTAMMAVFAGFIMFLYYYRVSIAKKVYLSIAGLLCLGILGFYWTGFFEVLQLHRLISMFKGLFAGEPLSAVSPSRILLWQSALETIYNFPLFGVGPDMWQYISQYSISEYFFGGTSIHVVRHYSGDPHNLYLLVWLNYGIVSLIFYISMLYVAVKTGIQNIKEAPSNSIRTLSLGSFVALISWIVMNFFSLRFFSYFNFPTLLTAMTFWSIIAVILKLNYLKSASTA